jgi:hypothetical protein
MWSIEYSKSRMLGIFGSCKEFICISCYVKREIPYYISRSQLSHSSGEFDPIVFL